MPKNQMTPVQATHALKLMMRQYRTKDITESPEWNTLAHAVAELDRLYRLELIAEHAWCGKDAKHLDAIFGDPATADSPCLEWRHPVEEEE